MNSHWKAYDFWSHCIDIKYKIYINERWPENLRLTLLVLTSNPFPTLQFNVCTWMPNALLSKVTERDHWQLWVLILVYNFDASRSLTILSRDQFSDEILSEISYRKKSSAVIQFLEFILSHAYSDAESLLPTLVFAIPYSASVKRCMPKGSPVFPTIFQYLSINSGVMMSENTTSLSVGAGRCFDSAWDMALSSAWSVTTVPETRRMWIEIFE